MEHNHLGTPRRYPVGAELLGATEASIRLWAPVHVSVDLVVDGRRVALAPEGDGYFSARVEARAGSQYGFRLPGDERLYPDPASRWQPHGPEAPSRIVDLTNHDWQDASWTGVSLPGQVLYELHVGTFTPQGTWRAAEQWLPRLRDLGVTVIQMMPVAEFAGAFGWGYDGVQWFAPMHSYGTPGDLQHFVDTAHALQLGVILDVVYNHLGPSGNFLRSFSPEYFSRRHGNEWGDALNFDDEGAAPMRELVSSNVAYWIQEFHFDGLRLDATQQIFDQSDEHLLAVISRTARESAAPRAVIVIGEHEPQHARLIRPPEEGGFGLDGLFNEDYHHSVRVALTGVREAYFSDYQGTSQEWLSAAQHGFLFQGQYYPWQKEPRGEPALDRPPFQFVNFIENHDQVANSLSGARLISLTSPAWWRAMSALLLLGPWTPLLFQGQEWGSTSPFRFFCDHAPELQAAVVKGRREFLGQFSRCREAPLSDDANESIGRTAFESSRLDHQFGSGEQRVWDMYRDLLTLRRTDPSIGQPAVRPAGATFGDNALLLRYTGPTDRTARLVVVNLGPDRDIARLAEPLAAPPAGCSWDLLWCSENPAYGGGGIAGSTPPHQVIVTGHSATVFQPRSSS